MPNQSKNNDKRLMIPLREAAEMMSMCRQTLMEYVKKGCLPCVRLQKNAVYFRLSDLLKFINDHLEEYNPISIPKPHEVQ